MYKNRLLCIITNYVNEPWHIYLLNCIWKLRRNASFSDISFSGRSQVPDFSHGNRECEIWSLIQMTNTYYIVPLTEIRSVKLTNINLFPKRNLDSNQNKSKRVRMGCSQGRQLCVVLICLCVNSFPTKWRSCYYTSGQLRHYHHHHYHLSHRWHHHYQTSSLRLETSSSLVLGFWTLLAQLFIKQTAPWPSNWEVCKAKVKEGSSTKLCAK